MNKEQVYDASIAPLMAQIIEICQEHHIAMLATFAIPVESDADLYCTTRLADETGKLPDVIAEANRAIMGRAPLILTTRNEDGEITSMTAIV